MERSRVLQNGNPKISIFSQKFEIVKVEFCSFPECPYSEKRNHPSFANISPTLVIDASLERSSRILQHGNPKF